jgi:hypothetical protein
VLLLDGIIIISDPCESNESFEWLVILHGGSGKIMAQIQLQVPATFNFSNPDEWRRWKRRFEQYRCASGLTPHCPDVCSWIQTSHWKQPRKQFDRVKPSVNNKEPSKREQRKQNSMKQNSPVDREGESYHQGGRE